MKPKARRSARTARKGKTAKLSPDEQAETNQNEAKSSYLEIDIPDPTKEVNLNLEQRNLAPKQEAKSTRKASFDRSLRLQIRQVHLFSLLISAQFMSKTFNTDYFKALSLSIVPLHLHRQLTPEVVADGRTLVNGLSMLSNWWKNYFGLKLYTFPFNVSDMQSFTVKGRILRAIESKCAYEDDYVRIFAALTRSFGIRTRIVSSLRLIPVNPKDAKDKINKSSTDTFQYVPTNWVECFNPADNKWFPVDCIRASVNCRQSLSILPSKHRKGQQISHIFVIAAEENGYIIDVTKRYTSRYYSETWKHRLSDESCFNEILSLLNRGLKADYICDEQVELESYTISEPMPDTLSGFTSHGRLVLESKCRKYEILWPLDSAIGEFKGIKIFPRSSLRKLRSKDAWYTQYARLIKDNEVPVKTIQLPRKKKKGLIAPDEDPYEPGAPQPLYGEWQTLPYEPPCAKDGKVPRNSHGNVDLFRLEMLPHGCAYIPYNTAWKSAKDLGVDYAGACVRFAFHGRMAVPNIQGIVVCKEDENRVLAHYYKKVDEDLQKETAEMQRQDILKRRREALSIKITKRLQTEYSNEPSTEVNAESNDNIQSAFKLKGGDDSELDDIYFE